MIEYAAAQATDRQIHSFDLLAPTCPTVPIVGVGL